MSIFLKLIDDYSMWLYVAAAVVALILLRAAILARRDRIQATFGLERETAHNREIRILTIAVIVLLLMGGIYAVERFVVPNVEIPYEPAPSPSPIFLPTVTATPGPPTATPTPTPTIARPTRPPMQTETPTPVAVVAPACPHPGVNLTAPGVGAQVSGVVSVSGTAVIERFSFYKVELGVGNNPGDWSFLFSGESPVRGGALGQWDTGPVAAGQYTLRLVVVDETGNFPQPCQVTVTVVK
jgi:hypothetical protein